MLPEMVSRRAPLRRWTLVLLAGLAVHAVHGLTGFGGPAVDWLVVQGLYNGLMAAAVVACVLRARAERAERRAWSCLAAGLAAWLTGEVLWSLGLGDPDGQPTVCDLFYLAFYPLALAGCLALAHERRSLDAGVLDAVCAALAVAAAGSTFLLDDALTAPDGEGWGALLAFTYPALDLAVAAVVVGIAARQGLRVERRWALLAAGLLLGALGDAVYYAQVTAGGYVEGGLLDSVWPASVLLIAWASTFERDAAAAADRSRSMVLPLALAAVALAVLASDHVVRAPTASVVLACAALVAVLLRSLLTFRENEVMLQRSQREALSDGLTGLPNRRALARELDAVISAGAPATLLLYDLDGFKLYNDSFGHPAGDALLVRLSARLLESLGPADSAFRMGGDEFCVLLRDELVTSSPAAELALRERGEGFDVAASFGAVRLPQEAADATDALRIVDQRLYAGKERRRASAGAQAGDALLRVLGEREPELHTHLRDVAHLADAVAAELALDPEAVAEVRRAAELHDVGKMALPDLILHKPGPLTAEERTFVEQHTIVGERILGAAPALRAVGRIVRSSHERWDGGGYPDGLRSDAIPIGARIVFACDAYDAMVSERPYRRAGTPEAALEELQRCAGTQFDPAVVAAFTRVVARGLQPRSLSSRSVSST